MTRTLRNQRSILLALLSMAILSLEVIATRIASVIFVSDQAYIILSVGILGLGAGGFVAHARERKGNAAGGLRPWHLFLLLGISLTLFAVAVTTPAVTSPALFLPLLLTPFVIAGYLSARLYRGASGWGSFAYASDLGGAVIGALASLWIINTFGGVNAVLCITLVAWGGTGIALVFDGRKVAGGLTAVLILSAFAGLFSLGQKRILGEVPIGVAPEKDFYTVYDDPGARPRIIDSRWSVFGRADLVAYGHQDMVMQLFVDGAAGSQVYRFNGDLRQTNPFLHELLLHHTNAIPFLCLPDSAKRRMLVIGPGGGKDVLLGLLGGAGSIRAVEVNPDFVAMVRDHRSYTGGIYSEFANVSVVVDEGRRHVQRMRDTMDLIVMALPSTAQVQGIEAYATNENFLLTREAFKEYARVLSPWGAIVLTVHNPWELSRVLVTAVSMFQDAGVPPAEIPHHFALLESEYAPTIVIGKKAFSTEESVRWRDVCARLRADFPRVTYLPHGVLGENQSPMNGFLHVIAQSPIALQAAVDRHAVQIAPCTDDSPYFYNRFRSGPRELHWLLVLVGLWCLVVALVALLRRRPATHQQTTHAGALPEWIALCAGAGFMIVEVSLLQKLVLWVGTPTTSLAVLLAILLTGAGVGSLISGALASRIRPVGVLLIALIAIVVLGVCLIVASPHVLSLVADGSDGSRLGAVAVLLLPLAVVLGIPFPVALGILAGAGRERAIPRLYALSCSFGVLGSVLAILVSVVWGFTVAILVGLAAYGVLIIPAARVWWRADQEQTT
ncbi:MAG: hypothetical protein IPI01_17645 [Ignavibacteriae bacterium]|nr:hypothetical protein [Ignavibacteriota bacterium]